jgi:hypothetical protein
MYSDDELDNKIVEWHDGPAYASMRLHEFLGWTWDEYKHWVETNEQPADEEEDMSIVQWENDGGVPPRCI